MNQGTLGRSKCAPRTASRLLAERASKEPGNAARHRRRDRPERRPPNLGTEARRIMGRLFDRDYAVLSASQRVLLQTNSLERAQKYAADLRAGGAVGVEVVKSDRPQYAQR